MNATEHLPYREVGLQPTKEALANQKLSFTGVWAQGQLVLTAKKVFGQRRHKTLVLPRLRVQGAKGQTVNKDFILNYVTEGF